MAPRYWLDVRDKPGFLLVVMRALAGQALMSFEGKLIECSGLFAIAGATSSESTVLRRNTIHPLEEFVVVPLEENTVAAIFKEVEPDGRIVRDITHIQIAKHGLLAVGAYDNFHRDCVTWWGASEASLNELTTKGILRAFEQAPDEGAGA